MKPPKLFGLLAQPPKFLNISLALFPFLILIGIYLYASHQRHLENPHDKILPTATQMGAAVKRVAIDVDQRLGVRMLVQDTKSSMLRLGVGVSVAALLGLLLGLNMGLFRGLSAFTAPFITFISIIPPLAILPILFISFGIGEFAKIMLIFIGTFPLITRTIYQITQKIPQQQIIKALTLGASQLQVVYQIIFPQIMPHLINALRLSFGSAWLFLIAAEAIASVDGLGYRIFLVRRYLSMDVIIPYTLWITFLGFSIDWFLRKIISWKYSWFLAVNK